MLIKYNNHLIHAEYPQTFVVTFYISSKSKDIRNCCLVINNFFKQVYIRYDNYENIIYYDRENLFITNIYNGIRFEFYAYFTEPIVKLLENFYIYRKILRN